MLNIAEQKREVASHAPLKPTPQTTETNAGNSATWRAIATGRGAIQRKLAVSEPGDIHEQQADQIADQVMRMTPPSDHEVSSTSGHWMGLQRKCDQCEEEDEKSLQRKHDGRDNPLPGAPAPAVNQILSQPGQPLDTETRAFMEPRLGRSFDRVRVHTDPVADSAARSVGALAFTLGRDVAFRAGQYSPNTSTGRRLIAHELAHVAQGASPEQIRPYRDVKKSERAMKNWGAIDDTKAGLEEKSAPGKGEPVIETIHIKFSGSAPDTLNPGELLVTGQLVAKYRAADKRADINIPVTGGSSAAIPFGLTDRITKGEKVQKVQGPGYNDIAVTGRADAQPAPPKESSHYVKKTTTPGHAAFDFNSSMGLAVYFKGAQAIHLGGKTQGSHACIHVDWTGNKDEMRLINYHSLIGFTSVTVEYDKNAAFKAVCCAPTRLKRGFVNPCNVYSAADCAPPAPAKP